MSKQDPHAARYAKRIHIQAARNAASAVVLDQSLIVSQEMFYLERIQLVMGILRKKSDSGEAYGFHTSKPCEERFRGSLHLFASLLALCPEYELRQYKCWSTLKSFTIVFVANRTVSLLPSETKLYTRSAQHDFPEHELFDGSKPGYNARARDAISNDNVAQVDIEGKELPENGTAVYPADTLSIPRQIFLVGTLCTAMFTNQVGMGNTLTTVGVIGDSFGIANQGQLSWLIAGYSLTVGTFILVGGRLGDEFGNKKLFVIGMSWYALWCLVAGLSAFSSHVLFVFARVFQGMGPALTLPNALAILGQSYSPGPRQNMAFAWFGASAPFGAIAGFLFGGLFALAWWPWIYWSQAIALAAVAVFAAWIIPPLPVQPEQNQDFLEQLDSLDIPGMVTGVTALVLFNFAWNQAVVVGWQEPYISVCLILGLLFAAGFFWVEIYHARSPILPLAVFNSDIAFVFACTATGWACFGIWVFYIGQVALNIGGNTPLQMAAWFIPVIPSGLVSALAVGRFLGKVPASWIMIVGQVAYVVGSILAAARPVHSVYWAYYFFSVLIITVGMDTSFPSATIIFSNAVPRRYQGMGASIVMTVVNYSISLGLGFAGTIETNINNGGSSRPDMLLGYRGALWFAVGLAGLGLVLSLWFVVNEHLKGKAKA
ncbi:uncharacterized protein Z520_04975 [Fonsecaea multimorphosa CBS 102226]|uniref:Major facilitator superfamily (MFS) profile domain-containing protein n=1 Tax=Fonsecaea multimorphosa CBS 102226 TaxID=1442371 RepID=A0A0D2K8E8_9EURO|nr:uncharacterized protein Z520_04975 [Fonsecaea multimorphosa CBS 102226]KIX99399.1 hypothetical protein Z520_04975 [Fonsecaea multimorphosa CBS 102226]